MRQPARARCFTRFQVDDCQLQIAQLREVMQRIEASLLHIPAVQRAYVANALLSLAITKLIKETGITKTAGMYRAWASSSPMAMLYQLQIVQLI